MEHLNRETLARLVDEPPEGNEQDHLEECSTCRQELEALESQTRALADLPDLLPPRGDWESLEARLRNEGLLRDDRRARRAWGTSLFESAAGAKWRGIAAGLALFLGGSAFGFGASAVGSGTGFTPAFPGPDQSGSVTTVSRASDLEEAVEGVRLAEESYVEALNRYRDLLEQSGGESRSYDPITRFAALDALVAASQAAVREAPTDPFLNGMLVSTVAERQATLQRISYTNDNWY